LDVATAFFVKVQHLALQISAILPGVVGWAAQLAGSSHSIVPPAAVPQLSKAATTTSSSLPDILPPAQIAEGSKGPQQIASGCP
jgi:hypothetical protein